MLRKQASLVGLLLVLPILACSDTRWIVEQIAYRHPGVLFFVETEKPVVALTIDDSPDPVATATILDVLAANKAQATFFVITDRIPGNERVLRLITKAGHEIANHLTRDEPSIELSPREFEHQLLAAQAALEPFFAVKWFRPGSGWFNETMLHILAKYGYRCVLGSVYPFDPQIPSTGFAARFILKAIHPGAIIILHDGGTRGLRTAAVLATILPELNRRGFQVVTVSELLQLQTVAGK